MTTTEIVAYLAERYGYQISRADAWRVKQKALELQFGTFYDSYNHTPRLLQKIKGYRGNNHHFEDIMETEVTVYKDLMAV